MRHFVATIALLASMPGTVSAADSAPPNILILYADDMGFGDLGANSATSKIPTPALDKLAADGVRFTDAHSSSGICSPSRYAMLTGRHHWRDFHGIVNAFGKSVFRKGQLTMPEMLRQSGYETACIGKWHLGWDWEPLRKPGTDPDSVLHRDFDWSLAIPDGPLAHGFDHYFGDNVINFPPYAWIQDDKLLEPPNAQLEDVQRAESPPEGGWECRPGPALSDWDFAKCLPTMTARCCDFLRDRKNSAKPFFLYAAFPSPHAPIIPGEAFRGRSQAGPYGDYVVETDDACGQILAALEESGLARNTIVIFSADNGPENFAYARDARYDHWSSGPFRGLKRDIYEGGHHVPMVLRWPAGIQGGRISDALVSQVDLMATLGTLAGAQVPDAAAEDSVDFSRHLRDPEVAGPRDVMVHNTFENQYALRHRQWLLIDAACGAAHPAPEEWKRKHDLPADSGAPVQLFDLSNDPGQKSDLAAAAPERVTAMQEMLKEIRAGDRTAPLRRQTGQ